MANTSAVSSFSYGGSTIYAVGSASVSVSRPPIETTPIGSFNTYFEPGISTSVAGIDCYYATADHQALVNELLAPSGWKNLTITFASGDTFSGDAIVIGWDAVTASADVTRGSFAFQVQGAVTVNGTTAVTGDGEVAGEGGV